MNIREKIRVATWDDEENIAAMMTLAFCSDPFIRWLLPDPYSYVKDSETYPGRSSGPAFDNGSAFVTEDMGGAALWLTPGCHVDRQAVSNTEDDFTDPAVLGDSAKLREKSDRYRPSEPHWCLTLIAVDPAKRGRGYGTALSHALELCDRDKSPAYLESTNAQNISLCKRHGFELLAEVQVGSSPCRYPMSRPPR